MTLELPEAELRQLMRQIVLDTVEAVHNCPGTLKGHRLAYSEPEAASALGVKAHVLRDARLRGEIQATKIGGRIGYEAAELKDYLTRNRINQQHTKRT